MSENNLNEEVKALYRLVKIRMEFIDEDAKIDFIPNKEWNALHALRLKLYETLQTLTDIEIEMAKV